MSPAKPNARSAYAREYRQANIEKARQRDQDYLDRNRDEINRRRWERYQAKHSHPVPEGRTAQQNSLP